MRVRRDDGYVEERSAPAPPGPAAGQGDPWRPWPGPDGAAPEDGWPRRRPPWRRWRQHQWVGRPHGSGPLRRSREDRLVAGLAAGIAARTGVDVTLVRLAFVVAALLGGFGVAAYVAGWLLLPAEGADGSIASRALNDRRGLALAAGLGSLLIIILVIASMLGARWLSSVAWALVVSVVGITLIWRNTPPDEHAVLRRLADPVLGMAGAGGRRRPLLRIVAAALLLIIGLAALLSGRSAHALLGPLAGLLLVITAIVIMLGPWWLRIARDLVLERQARARAEERADMAAHLHDSVLQTLALIQRRADQPQQVIQLARAQERELRSWLFDGQPPGSLAGQGVTLAAGVRPTRSLVAVARPHLVALAGAAGEAAGLSIPDGGLVHYVDQVDSPHPVGVRDWTGTRLPMHAVSSGLVFLAHMLPAEVDVLLARPLERFTPATVVDPAAIRERLRRVLLDGYAWTAEEVAEGITSVAAAVSDEDGEVVAAVHVHGPSYRFPGSSASAATVAAEVVAAAARISARIRQA